MQRRRLIQILIFFTFISSITIYAQENPSYVVKTIVLDAGHGGKDPGAIGKISQEKNITLALALKVGNLIAANCPDVQVVYTRKTDEFIELHKRAEIANKNKADLFISIHVNASTNQEAYGTDTWTMGLAKSEANLRIAKLENDVISLENNSSQYQGMSENDEEAIILHNVQQGIFTDNSLVFASMIQNQLKTSAGRKDRSVHQAPFLVLWKTAMPSVLIETGFITNIEEEKYLNKDENQGEMAYAIYRAFVEYKTYIENRSKGKIQAATNTSTSTSTNKNNNVAKTTNTTTKTQTTTSNTKTQSTASKTTSTKTETKTTKTLNSEDIYYGIQLSATKEKKDPNDVENFKNLKGVYMLQENGLYKYYYGKTATYKEISGMLSDVKDIFPSAFIVAHDKNNKRLQLSEAKAKTK